MDPEGILQSEISRMEEDKFYMISLECGISKIRTRRNKEQVGGCGGLGAGEGGQGHTLSIIGQIRSQDSHAPHGDDG